jgi:hypothetical protein
MSKSVDPKHPTKNACIGSKQKKVEAKDKSAHLTQRPLSLTMGAKLIEDHGLQLLFLGRCSPTVEALVEAWRPRFNCTFVDVLPEHKDWI